MQEHALVHHTSTGAVRRRDNMTGVLVVRLLLCRIAISTAVLMAKPSRRS